MSTSIYLILFFIGNLEIGYATGKGPAVCAQMHEMIEVFEALWGEQVDASCRDTGIPFLRPVARP